jgi:hypothetical protein
MTIPTRRPQSATCGARHGDIQAYPSFRQTWAYPVYSITYYGRIPCPSVFVSVRAKEFITDAMIDTGIRWHCKDSSGACPQRGPNKNSRNGEVLIDQPAIAVVHSLTKVHIVVAALFVFSALVTALATVPGTLRSLPGVWFGLFG